MFVEDQHRSLSHGDTAAAPASQSSSHSCLVSSPHSRAGNRGPAASSLHPPTGAACASVCLSSLCQLDACPPELASGVAGGNHILINFPALTAEADQFHKQMGGGALSADPRVVWKKFKTRPSSGPLCLPPGTGVGWGWLRGARAVMVLNLRWERRGRKPIRPSLAGA